jgi:hypothetical protein
VPCASKRDSQAFGDVSEREILEADEFESFALLIWQLGKAGGYQPPTFVTSVEAGPAIRAGIEPKARVDAQSAGLKRIHLLERIATVCDAAAQ